MDIAYDVDLEHDVILDVHVLPRVMFESLYYRNDFWQSNVLQKEPIYEIGCEEFHEKNRNATGYKGL